MTHEEKYQKVLSLMEKGHTMFDACKKLHISRGWFQKCLTPAQKVELKELSIGSKKKGVRSGCGVSINGNFLNGFEEF